MATVGGCRVASLVLLRALDEAGRFPGRQFLVFTTFLVLMTWARLDSALFAFFLYAYVVFAIMQQPNTDKAKIAKYLALSVAIAVAGAAIQVGLRSEERRVGKGCVRPCSAAWPTYLYK